MIRSGSVEKTYPSGHGGGGGGSGVAGAAGASVGFALAADGGDEIGPGDVGGGGAELFITKTAEIDPLSHRFPSEA